MRIAVQMLLIGMLLVLCACGGGPNASLPAGIADIPAPAISGTATPIVTLGLQPVIAVLPSIAGATGTIAFPAVAQAATLRLDVSATAPAPALTTSAIRRASAALQLHIYEYVTLTPDKTIALRALPAMTFTYPASAQIAGASFFYGITDPATQPGALQAFQTEGPGKVVGQRMTIGAVARPIVLQALHHYTFVVYALSVATTVVTPTIALLFDDSKGSYVTLYAPDGLPRAPVLTSFPYATDFVVDSAGNIHLLNGNVYTYSPSGALIPPTITLPVDDPGGRANYSRIAVGADGATYVSSGLGCGFGGCYVGTMRGYSRDGTPRFVVSLPTILPPSSGALGSAITVSATGDILVTDGANIYPYKPDGTLASPPLVGFRNITSLSADGDGRVYVVDDDGLTRYNVDGSGRQQAIFPNFVLGAQYEPHAVAVDGAGKIYVIDSSDSQILTFNPDGSPSAPTITAAALSIDVH